MVHFQKIGLGLVSFFMVSNSMVGSAVSLAEEIVSPDQTGQSEIDDENQISSSLAEDPLNTAFR